MVARHLAQALALEVADEAGVVVERADQPAAAGAGPGTQSPLLGPAPRQHQLGDERLLEAEKEGRALRVYCGYDPRTGDLHLGHGPGRPEACSASAS